ncbi:hypothetical protein [Brevundimonas intermedia]|uniref:hypothetical protein n=1 Tax=Brevundimonas intermedia TaxID=74315 RepID=UPI00320B0CFB
MAQRRKEQFSLFRLSLLERREVSLFAPEETREQFLRRAFGDERVFAHYANTFHYVPHPEIDAGGVIMGAIGRQVEAEENLPPRQGLAESVRETWKAAVVALDPVDHEDGQKVAFEIDPKVGGPTPLLASLVASINGEVESRYIIEAGPILNKETFWAWVRASDRTVTDIVLDVPAPNGLFNTNKKMKAELKTTRETTGAETVTIGLHATEGLKTNSESIEDAIDYAQTSGGRIRAKDSEGSSFLSTTSQKTTTLPDDNSGEGPLIVRAARLIREVFGR